MWEERREIYDRLVALCPEIERKGKTVPYTSANGHMFSQLNKDGQIGIRLPEEERARFLEEYDSGPFLSYGSVMRGYVLIPDELLDDLDRLATYLEMGHEYVMSLEPK